MESLVSRKANFGTERECWFALRWLNLVEKLNPPSHTGSTLEILNKQINQVLDTQSGAGTQKIRRDDRLYKLECAVKENILPDTDFAWFEKNAIVTLCLWWQLKMYRRGAFFRDKEDFFKHKDIILRTLQKENEKKLFESANTSQEERLKCIITYLDSLIVIHSEIIYTKAELLDKIKSEYINERPVRLSPAWLVQNDKEACKWAWGYISDYQRKHLLKKNKGKPVDDELQWFFINNYHPDESELGGYFLATHVAFELWGEGDDARELFITRMNRAWNQYKLRHSRKDKKPVNCYVDSNTKKKLEKYCKQTNKTITEVIEGLINNHCDPLY